MEQNLGVGSDEPAVAIAKLLIDSVQSMAAGGFEIGRVWCCAGGNTGLTSHTNVFRDAAQKGICSPYVRGTVGYFLGSVGANRLDLQNTAHWGIDRKYYFTFWKQVQSQWPASSPRVTGGAAQSNCGEAQLSPNQPHSKWVEWRGGENPPPLVTPHLDPTIILPNSAVGVEQLISESTPSR